MRTGPSPSPDPIALRLIAFLRDLGADAARHAGGRTLLDHLIGTADLLRRWDQPESLVHAALIHSVYGTAAYRTALLELDRRGELSAIAGERAERLAYLFSQVSPRRVFAPGERWAPGLTEPADRVKTIEVTRDELDALAMLHLANLADQACGPDGVPAAWLTQLRDRAEVLLDSPVVRLPLFLAGLATVSADDEIRAREAYADGIADLDPARLALAAALLPIVPEPCGWLAYACSRRGDDVGARQWAEVARRRLNGIGTPWDKRLGIDAWFAVFDALARGASSPAPLPAPDPRALHAELVTGARARSRRRASTPVDGEARFGRYLRRIADAAHPDRPVLYPDLERVPFWDADRFPIVAELRRHAATIERELLGIDPTAFAPESEPIHRTGAWDVLFFHERGRRNGPACEACPVTARVVSGPGAMLTAAGLSYASRMRARTHIAAHRGPTNLRLRCHLGISVPAGDCGIRVGTETRSWRAGDCLVFDDSFDHEAWNATDDERLVLIVDLWHPDLSATEVHLLSGLHRHSAGYARRLSRYWNANAAARGEPPAA